MKLSRLLILSSLLAIGTAASAQMMPPPQNVVQLSVNGSVEVQQDLLSITMNTSREGADPAAVQAQLKTALDAALTEARNAVLPGQLAVRTGNFSLYPRYGRDGKMTGRSGSAELVLEGRDIPLITQTAARMSTLTMGGGSCGLSWAHRARVET